MLNRDKIENIAQHIIEKVGTNGVWEAIPHFTENGLSMQFTNPNLRTEYHVPDKRLGYYIIYDDCYDEPVYVGFGNVGNRIYRFFKEIYGKSRKDETHPAANRYRKNTTPSKILQRKWKVTVIWEDDIEISDKNPIILCHVDERIAELLNSRFNRKTIGNFLPL